MAYTLRPGEPGYSKWDDPAATWAPPAPGRYCLARCYCGQCGHYVPMSERATNTPARTTFDLAAEASGKRASGARRRAAR